MLREINTEFDVIIDRIAQESGNNPKAFVGSCEMKYPLTAGSGIFKGKKPAAVIFGGKCVAVRTWRQLVGEIMTRCISIPAYRIAPESLAGKVSGKKRGVLSAAGKPDLAPILMHLLNQGETAEEATARRNTEQHRLADRSGSTPVPGFRKNRGTCRFIR